MLSIGKQNKTGQSLLRYIQNITEFPLPFVPRLPVTLCSLRSTWKDGWMDGCPQVWYLYNLYDHIFLMLCGDCSIT